jgi:hypothetical protein
MSTKYADIFAALAAPFEHDEVKTRAQAGHQLHYITARTVMNRLDNVLGPENWWDEYSPSENSVLCRLTIVLPDGHVLTKCDAGGYAGMADQGDDDKSGFSDAFKRAAVKFGVARYLYRDGVPAFVRERLPEAMSLAPQPAAASRPKSPTDPPRPPRPPLPGGSSHGNGDGPQRQYDGPPKSGKALFAWTKEQEQRHEVGLLKYLNSWSRLQDWPARMTDWDAEQVALAHAEAMRKLQDHEAGASAGREPGEEG